MNKIRKGDEVIVIAGKDKGKRGVVLAVGADRVTVEGINLVKKHVKPNPMKGTQGGERDSLLIRDSVGEAKDKTPSASGAW